MTGRPGGGPPAPLAGVRVVELASYVTGPYAAALLADMGADVVKVEERTEGDPLRNWAKGGYSAVFRSVNRGKRSIGLDVRTPAGREVLLALIDRADVFVENARPGVAERLGCGYETVSARNPRLVYCSVSGFGAHGPYRDRPGYDTVGQAMSGLLGLLTDFEDPRPMGVSLSDHVTGVFACYGILAALVGRAADGQGRHVETSLLRATTAFVAENAARYLDDGEVPTRATRAHIAQAYAFVAGDGLPFVVHLSSPQKFWASLTRAIERPELFDDPRFADRNRRVTHYDELHAPAGRGLRHGHAGELAGPAGGRRRAGRPDQPLRRGLRRPGRAGPGPGARGDASHRRGDAAPGQCRRDQRARRRHDRAAAAPRRADGTGPARVGLRRRGGHAPARPGGDL